MTLKDKLTARVTPCFQFISDTQGILSSECTTIQSALRVITAANRDTLIAEVKTIAVAEAAKTRFPCRVLVILEDGKHAIKQLATAPTKPETEVRF